MPTSVVWLRCASSAARRRSSHGLTSTRQWMADSGSPSGLPSSIGWSGSHSSVVGGAGRLGRLAEAAHGVAVHRRLEHPRAARGEVGAAVQHPVHLHVVGVAVAAVPVVADRDVGVLLVEHRREPRRRPRRPVPR